MKDPGLGVEHGDTVVCLCKYDVFEAFVFLFVLAFFTCKLCFRSMKMHILTNSFQGEDFQ